MDDLRKVMGGLTDLDDTSVCQVLADLLEERADPRAGDVRHLATVPCIIPEGKPQWRRLVAGDYLERAHWEACDSGDEGAVPYALPMACGSWWFIELDPDGVRGQVHNGTAWHNHIHFAVYDDYGFALVANLSAGNWNHEGMARAFEVVRRALIGALLDARIDRSLEVDGASARKMELRHVQIPANAA